MGIKGKVSRNATSVELVEDSEIIKAHLSV
jgi:hypothetical protein